MDTDRRLYYQNLLIHAFSPTFIDLIDESQHHVGHPGAQQGGSHFKLIISSPLFDGKSRLQSHRLIYDALGNAIGTDIHALSIHIRYD